MTASEKGRVWKYRMFIHLFMLKTLSKINEISSKMIDRGCGMKGFG